MGVEGSMDGWGMERSADGDCDAAFTCNNTVWTSCSWCLWAVLRGLVKAFQLLSASIFVIGHSAQMVADQGWGSYFQKVTPLPLLVLTDIHIY